MDAARSDGGRHHRRLPRVEGGGDSRRRDGADKRTDAQKLFRKTRIIVLPIARRTLNAVSKKT